MMSAIVFYIRVLFVLFLTLNIKKRMFLMLFCCSLFNGQERHMNKTNNLNMINEIKMYLMLKSAINLPDQS